MSLLNFLAQLIFLLSDEGVLQPLLEPDETDLLSLLFLEPVFVFLLLVDQLVMMLVHDLSVFPFKHGMGSLLHPHGFFLLLLDEGFEQVSLGLGDQLLSEFGFMVLASGPLFVSGLQTFGLQIQDFGGIRSDSHCCSTSGVGVGSSILNSFVDQVLDTGTSSLVNSFPGNIDDVVSGICKISSSLSYVHVTVWIWVHFVRSIGKSLHQSFILFEQLLVVINTVVLASFIMVPLMLVDDRQLVVEL